jgi:hypothetical protein
VELDEKLFFFSLSGAFSTEQFYFLHFLWFKIMSSKFQICLGQRPNTKKGAGYLDHIPHREEDQSLPPVNRPDLTYDRVNIGPQKKSELDAACVPREIKTYGQNYNVQNEMWGYVLIPT